MNKNRLTSVLAAALFATALPMTLAAPSSAAEPGQVCFYSQPGHEGDSWCYTPGTGFADAPETVRGKARSFESSAGETVYALHFPAGGGTCQARTIHPGDYSSDWQWGSRLDAVDSTPLADCEQA
ncbi:hypothetical protein YW5DRAFT_05945 [Streptomyces sp. Ncost-T6T-1]|uniref:hypothetical protein n=1 Tax=Streptomyces sp. Ncost-T6T-1 TaxID=1100828 RepID=UPI000804F0F2|nr:hypothetical protein [Streptomyces sp. Ncost-T6T-1]SBU98588.1 hypothetical protein YW5DRAFT_05945 [Streptomyces sp. Ncost-T6T-1]